MLTQILPDTAFALMLIFVRVGAIMMVMPGFGERFITPRFRLVLAVAVSVIIFPVILPVLPSLPVNVTGMAGLLLGEIAIGVFIGGSMRMLVAALQVGGVVISFQSSLGFAQFFDPGQGTQGAIISSFLTMIGMTLIFVADLHHVMMRAIADSYTLFPLATLPDFSAFAEIAAEMVANAFAVGMQIAAPFIGFAMVLYIGMGLINRLMPQMQVFFIVMPLQILSALTLLALTLSAICIWYLDYFEQGLLNFVLER